MHELSRAEAAARAALVRVESYEIDLDLSTGAERFGSTTRVRFGCAEPGASTFVELVAPMVHTIRLNGRGLVVDEAYHDERIRLDDLEASNELTVVAECAYEPGSEGMHRFADPADGLVYVHSECEPYDAHRIFACFDQPDLRASVSMTVTAPADWTVVANGPVASSAAGRWAFEPTPSISPYLVAIAAGPYHSVSDLHDGIPLGLHCRRSMAPYLEPDEILEITRRSFDFFHAVFGVRYPFVKYDQVFSPEFGGAMEHPGCVTFGDSYLFRSRATEAQRLERAWVIAHEMAHMWFGDLVTMRWWDDLWLKESFADYASTLALAEGTRFTDAWTSFSLAYKPWGYRQDQLSTTHPISAADVVDTEGARLNFDGISYAKGAAVLRQLVAWVGREPFWAGMRRYIADHAYGNTTLADLLEELERSSGRDLAAWSDEWLRTAGVDTLRTSVVLRDDGRYDHVTVRQTAPATHPTLRSHRLRIGLYDRRSGRLVRRDQVELDVVGGATPVPALRGVPSADLLVPNDGDLTWAKVRLDDRSFDTIRLHGIHAVEDPLTRAVLWYSLFDMVRDAELRVGDYLEIALASLPGETTIDLAEAVLDQVREAIDRLGDPAARPRRLRELASGCRGLTEAAEPGSDLQLAHARSFLSAISEPEEVELAGRWLNGSGIPAGLAMDADLRWTAVGRLASIGAIGEKEIAREYASDTTANGERAAARARAALPDRGAKARAWAACMTDAGLSEALLRATASGFWQPHQRDLTAPYVERFFDEILAVDRMRTPSAVQDLTRWLYPWVAIEPSTVERTDALLARDQADALLRRGLVEQRDELQRAMRAREADAG